MSCGCKNKNKQPQKIQMVKQDNVVELIELEEPPYPLEEVQRVREYFMSRMKHEEENLKAR